MFEVTGVRAQHRILDFDIENRPLSYWWGDATTAEITAIGWSWADSEDISVEVLLPPPYHESSAVRMIQRFVESYDRADVVTGHFIRMHDLPVLNSSLLELGLPGLSAKMTIDTKIDLVRHGKISVSQQTLADMLDIPKPKVQMPQAKWRDANRLTEPGIAKAIARVTGDVAQHKLMRLELVRRGLLTPPKMWTP